MRTFDVVTGARRGRPRPATAGAVALAFAGTERVTLRGRDGGGRFVTRFAAVIRGRVDPDGSARGTVSNTQTTTRPGGRGASVRCRTGNRRFVAAP